MYTVKATRVPLRVRILYRFTLTFTIDTRARTSLLSLPRTHVRRCLASAPARAIYDSFGRGASASLHPSTPTHTLQSLSLVCRVCPGVSYVWGVAGGGEEEQSPYRPRYRILELIRAARGGESKKFLRASLCVARIDIFLRGRPWPAELGRPVRSRATCNGRSTRSGDSKRRFLNVSIANSVITTLQSVMQFHKRLSLRWVPNSSCCKARRLYRRR